MICSICNREFTPRGARRKYCGYECSAIAEIRRSNRRHKQQRARMPAAAPRDPVDDFMRGCGGLKTHSQRIAASGRTYNR